MLYTIKKEVMEMCSFLSVLNKSSDVLCIIADDEVMFCDILPDTKTKSKKVMYASIRVIIKTSREKPIFDLWLPIKKETSHTLTVRDTSFDFI